MREVRRSALLPYSADRVYGLVADVRAYPEFLPWCTSAEVLADQGDVVTVVLGLARGVARASFTTRNLLVPGRSIAMQLVEGPFTQLEGRWEFCPIGESGARVELLVRFATRGVFGMLALEPAFEQICNQLVDAFARRAKQVFDGG